METPSSVLAWRIPQTEEPGGLQSIGSQSRTGLKEFTCMHHTAAQVRHQGTHGSLRTSNPKVKGVNSHRQNLKTDVCNLFSPLHSTGLPCPEMQYFNGSQNTGYGNLLLKPPATGSMIDRDSAAMLGFHHHIHVPATSSKGYVQPYVEFNRESKTSPFLQDAKVGLLQCVRWAPGPLICLDKLSFEIHTT